MTVISRILALILAFIMLFVLQPGKEPIAAESVTIRFYYHCAVADPDFTLHPDAYRYTTVEIPDICLREQFPCLMYTHTGISIQDLWLIDGKLYVNLCQSEEAAFDQGSVGSADRGHRLINTIASLPGLKSFEILIGGRRGVETSHYGFNWIAIVENGVIIRFDPQ